MNSFLRHAAFASCALLVLIICVTSQLIAQVRPVYDQGAIGLGQILKRIQNTKRIMHIGAHPDDEDSDMLAYLARKENARTVYLSLTRGDGGQNVIGPELFEALGVIRTEELLQARTLDGAEQMFTRAFDYGYSKRLSEAQSFWDEETIKCDVVSAIRSFRPHVVVPRFTGTPLDGHGQHQFAGYISPIAVKAAADPDECKDSGPVWKVSKFYVGQGFRDTNPPMLRMNTGEYDYLIGRSYYEIAAQGRSQHKTQEQGSTELKGDRYSGVNLVESTVSTPYRELSMFDGDIDYSIEGNLQFAELRARLKGIDARIEKLSVDFKADRPFELLPQLTAIASELRAAEGFVEGMIERTNAGDSSAVLAMLRQKSAELKKAIRLASGLQIDAIAESETIAPGETVAVNINVFYPDSRELKVLETSLALPEGWSASGRGEQLPAASESPFFARFRENPRESVSYKVTVSPDQKPTQPYFLENPRQGYLYQWSDAEDRNQPFQRPLMMASITVAIRGSRITFEEPVEYRYADDTRGELRRDVNVVPAVSLELDQPLLIVSRSDSPGIRHLSLNIQNNSSGPVSGTTALELPTGWKFEMPAKSFAIKNKGDIMAFDCTIHIPANAEPGSYTIRAVADANGTRFDQKLNTIRYDHIQTHRFYVDAATKVVVMDLLVAPVKVGYVMGSGDSGPEALRQMGLEVELLGKRQLANDDFSRFDAIVVGIRASETNPAYIANNERLLEYVRKGGALIIQYQKFPFQSLNLAPYPVQTGARVAEEDAKVTILEPRHPVFNSPNKITQSDFEGWVQERNLYALRSFDKRYTPLLESHDTDEEENFGGMVYARIGKGQYMYVSYSFFRQLPAGVPGAYRLFANIVSLGKKIE